MAVARQKTNEIFVISDGIVNTQFVQRCAFHLCINEFMSCVLGIFEMKR